MTSAGAILPLMIAGGRLRMFGCFCRLRVAVVRITVMVVMSMPGMRIGWHAMTAAAASSRAGQQHLRATAAKSWTKDYCERQVTNEC